MLSIGQVVPHEVIGLANYNKNILIGTAGPLSIHRSHYLGAVVGMERIMGRMDNPVRRVLNRAADEFLGDIPIVYVLTVIGTNPAGELVVRGLFVGDDLECFRLASELSVQVQHPASRSAHPQSRCLPRSGGVPQHLAGEQGHLPHADGAGRWRGADRARSRGQAIWRRPYHRPHDSQIWLSWHPGYAREGETRTLIWRPSLAPPLISSTAHRKAAFTSLIVPAVSAGRRQKA